MIYAGVDTSMLTEDEVLFIVRIKGRQHFFDKIYSKPVIDKLFGHFESYHTISEYRNADHYIDLKKFSVTDFTYQDFEIFNKAIKPHLSSIIFRCRGLRSIPFVEAKELILRVTKFWISFFQTNPNYKLMVIHIIDNYVLDVMYRIATHYNVKVLVLSEFFIYGYRRHTIYGEYVRSRDVSQEEVDEVLLYFKRREKSFWLKGLSAFSSFKYCSYLFFSYYVRVFLRYFIGYKILGNISYEYRFANQFGKILIRNFFIDKYFNQIDISQIEAEYKDAVYIPLHVYPEANVDYWIVDPNDSDYYNSVYESLSFFRDRNIKVYMKEHPGFLYQRDIDFYKKVNCFPNVCLVHPFDKNVDLVNNIENILVWHGSAGIEGIMQGKKVVVFDENYYSKNYIVSLKNYEQRLVFTELQKLKFLVDILTGTEKFDMK